MLLMIKEEKKNLPALASFWDSPYHLSVSIATSRLMNLIPASFAVALAIKVLPQPGGPKRRTPLGGWYKCDEENISRCFTGKTTLSFNSCTTWKNIIHSSMLETEIKSETYVVKSSNVLPAYIYIIWNYQMGSNH